MGRRHDRANAGGRGPTAARSLELVTGLAIAACQRAGVNVIADGSCILVVLGFRERPQ